MVKIEILPSVFREVHYFKLLDDLANAPSMNDKYPEVGAITIAELVKGSAAVQIQARVRGALCRQYKYKGFLYHDHSKKLNAALKIQKIWKNKLRSSSQRFGTYSNISTQTESCFDENNINMADGDGKNVNEQDPNTYQQYRIDFIRCEYDSYRQNLNKAVNLSGFEILNLLRAMSVLLPREYEILAKTVLSMMNDSKVRSNVTHRFNVRIIDSLVDFEEDITAAWKTLTQKTIQLSPSSAMFLSKNNISRRKLNSSSKDALLHLQNLCIINDESISILARNENILLYDRRIKHDFLASAGINPSYIDEHEGNTIVDHLETFLLQVESSFHRTRIKNLLDIVRSIVEWERSGARLEICTERKTLERKTLSGKDLVIAKLEDEVQRLKENIKTIEIKPCNFPKTQKKHQIMAMTKIAALEKSKTKQVQNAKSKDILLEYETHPVSGKYNMDAKEKKRQESINYVEIKFIECEKSGRKDIEDPVSSVFPPSKKHIRKNHYNHEREMSHNDFPRGTYTTKKPTYTRSSLAKTISQSREKHSISNKLSGSRKLKPFQSAVEIKHFQIAAENTNELQTMDMDSLNKHKNEAQEVTPDIRFNRILDKLRKAADVL